MLLLLSLSLSLSFESPPFLPAIIPPLSLVSGLGGKKALSVPPISAEMERQREMEKNKDEGLKKKCLASGLVFHLCLISPRLAPSLSLPKKNVFCRSAWRLTNSRREESNKKSGEEERVPFPLFGGWSVEDEKRMREREREWRRGQRKVPALKGIPCFFPSSCQTQTKKKLFLRFLHFCEPLQFPGSINRLPFLMNISFFHLSKKRGIMARWDERHYNSYLIFLWHSPSPFKHSFQIPVIQGALLSVGLESSKTYIQKRRKKPTRLFFQHGDSLLGGVCTVCVCVVVSFLSSSKENIREEAMCQKWSGENEHREEWERERERWHDSYGSNPRE